MVFCVYFLPVCLSYRTFVATGGIGFLSLEIPREGLSPPFSLSNDSFKSFVEGTIKPPSEAESTRFHALDIFLRFNFIDSSSCTSSPSKSSLA